MELFAKRMTWFLAEAAVFIVALSIALLNIMFTSSTEIDKDSSKARYEHGILTLTLNKKQKTVSQRLIIE